MLDKKVRDSITVLIKQEVVPAIGCTEPMAVALCVARTAEILQRKDIEHITVLLSTNIIKNAMGVGIPGTGMIGLPIAIALGALIGKSEYQLEVIKDLTIESLERGKTMIKEGRIEIKSKKDANDLLYIETIIESKHSKARAIISGSHTSFTRIEKDNVILFDRKKETNNVEEKSPILNMKLVYDYAITTPEDEIRFILTARDYNINAAHYALKGNYGHNLGKTIDRPLSQGILGHSIFSRIMARTAAACDARMGGALVPVMSNSGSGNQGICATNPVAVYAVENENTEEELVRALILSHLTAIYIKESLGRLSALCGCVVASIGSSCGITYLMGGGYEHICRAVKNMIANLTGMICDGAKPSCSLKICSGVSTAILSALLSMEGKGVTSAEGIIDNDVDKSIKNLTSIGADAMRVTDAMVIDIMTNKNC